MFKNIVPFVLALFVSSSLWAQIPREVVVLPSKSSSSRSSMMCTTQDAGTIQFGGADPANQSNDVRTLNAVDPIFLCWGDRFTVQHDLTSANFEGTPSAPGVGYAFYDCEPQESGLTLRDILNDPCIIESGNDPTNPLPLVYAVDDTAMGEALFSNEANIGTLSLQDVYNNSNPVRFWFTPITYDRFTNNEVVYEDGGNSCVNSDISQAFSVVYLNPIEVVNISTSACGGSLTIAGGLPEFGQSSYIVDIVNTDDNTITGILTGNAKHNEAVTFTVGATGEYMISITDNKTCETSVILETITCDDAATFTVETPCVDNIIVGDQFCLDFDVTNFNNIVSMQFRVDWDSTVLDFESVSVEPAIFTAIEFNSSFLSSTENGKLTLGGWITNDFDNGSTLQDNTTLFTVCFISKIAGNPDFRIADDPLNNSPIEIIDISSNQIAFVPALCPTIDVQPPPADGIINVQPDITLTCDGQDNGKIGFSFLGGMPPYSLDINGGNGYAENFRIFGRDTIIENLAADEYAYFVIDEGNTAQGNSPIGNPLVISDFQLNVTFEEKFPNCVGENSGSLTAIPLIFNTPADDPDQYTYQWSTSTNDTLQLLDSLTAGVYDVTVTDANGCSATDDENLFDPQELRINRIDVTPAQCSGTFDGSLEAMVTGGTGTIDYEWDIDPTRNNANIPNLDVGDYNLIVTDANGCTATDNRRVSGAIEIGIDATIDSCFSQANGQISVSFNANVAADIANWNYEWSPNVTNIVSSTGAFSVVNNLSPGTYEVTLTNSDINPQCFGSSKFEIEELPLTLAIDITNVTRCQLNIPDGSATVVASGGTPGPAGYDYTWTEIGGRITSGITAMNLDADSITVNVSDLNGCITELDTMIGSPAPPEIFRFDNDNIDCADGTGSLQVLARPGDADVTDIYKWEGPSLVTSTSSLIGTIDVGKYFVTVTDENNCETIDSAEVIAPPALNYSIFAIDNEPCFEASNGGFSLALTGGTVGYNYAWFDINGGQEVAGQTTSVENVPAGSYKLSGSDDNGCIIDTTITLTSLPEIIVEFDQEVRTSCALSNTPDGGARANASYADGSPGLFDFIWGSKEREDGLTQSTADSLGSGNISVVVFESDGICNTTAEVFIDSPEEISYNPSNEIIDNVSCFGFNDGEISTLSAASGGTPGTAGYSFEWTHLTTGNIFLGETISDLTAGDYTLVISDENDCLSNTITKIITQPELLTAEIDNDPNNTRGVKCAGDNDGQITIIATGGNDDLGPYTYEWTNNVSVGPVATDLESDITYEIVVADENGCEATAEYFVTEPAALIYSIPDPDPIQCFGEFTTIRLDPASFSGGNGGDYTYSVDGCPEKDVSEPSCQVRGGSIPITIFDSGGCAYDDVIEIDEPDQIVIEFPTAEAEGANFVTEVQLGGQIELNAEIFHDLGVPLADVIWTDTSVICPALGDCRNGTVAPLNNTIYTIEVVDERGCEESASILVEVDKKRKVYIPNAFAPNSRGFDLNESFKVYTGLGVRSVNFARVFNRWGTMVADIGTINDPSPSGITVWNGQVQGEKLAQGVYVYIISVTFLDNTTLLYRGDITLLR